MGFAHPTLLLLAFLAYPARRWWWLEGQSVLNTLRLSLFLLLVLALSRPELDRIEKGLDLFVLLDRSASISQEGRARQEELLHLLTRAKGKADRVEVIAFGQTPVVESPLQSEGISTQLVRDLDPNGSDLSAALELAALSASPQRASKILLLSDGLFTGSSPLEPERLASLSSLPVYVRDLGQERVKDVAAGDLELPSSVVPGAGFLVRFSLLSEGETEVSYRLSRGNVLLAEGVANLREGVNAFFVRDRYGEGEGLAYQLAVHTPGDAIPENDASSALLQVTSLPRILVASADGRPGLLHQSLEAAGMPTTTQEVGAVDFSAARLEPYRLVVLEDVALEWMGRRQVEALATAVSHGIVSLMVTGGPQAFGDGGYYLSPLDPLLPIRMHLEEEERRSPIALALVLDRSGSMSASVGRGTKMDLANLAAAESIRLLSGSDQVAVMAVDSEVHSIVPLANADDTSSLIALVLRIEAMGGGIFVRSSLQGAAMELRQATVSTRHILLFADAADAEEQEDSLEFADHLVKEDIRISVVALGSKADPDAAFLEALAAAGQGRIQFTDNPLELPQLFSGEVLRIAQEGFVIKETSVKLLPDAVRLRLPLTFKPPPVGGYNQSSLRPEASCAMATVGERSKPLLAFWQKGRAKVAALPFEVEGPHAGAFGAWSEAPRVLISLARHLTSQKDSRQVRATSLIAHGEAEVTLEVSPEIADILRASMARVRFLGPAGQSPLDTPLTWLEPTLAVGRQTLRAPGHYLPVLELGEGEILQAPPVTLPYSPEFLPQKAGLGRETLLSLALRTGGEEVSAVESLFDVSNPRVTPIARSFVPFTIFLMLVLALLEVAERRLELLSRAFLAVSTLGRLRKRRPKAC